MREAMGSIEAVRVGLGVLTGLYRTVLWGDDMEAEIVEEMQQMQEKLVALQEKMSARRGALFCESPYGEDHGEMLGCRMDGG